MRRVIIFAFFTFFSFNLFGQSLTDFTDIRIFINPGHGGLDSDDRHMLETDFWESEGNLSKGLYLKKLLESKNAIVFMSRITNTTEDDIPLSTIGAMSNDANADFFLSIHSNGFDGQRNQPLILFRGYDDDPVYPESKVFANMLFPKLVEKGDIWTRTDVWIRGDWDFYDWGTSGLGVLRTLTMPGVLSEGSFHDYIPEGWRLKNEDYLLSEAWSFYRSFAEYFDVIPETTGIIAGVLRNPLKSPDYYFAPNSVDANIPVNAALVTLIPGDKKYRIDNLNNGYFLFDSIVAGEYKVIFDEIPFFYTDTVEITVLKNKNTFVNMLLTQDTSLIPEILSLNPSNSDSIILRPEFVFEFSLNMDIESVENALSISPFVDMIYTWSENNTILSFKPQVSLSPKTTYNILLSTDAASQWKVPITDDFTRNYITVNHTELLLKEHYPIDGQTDLSPYLQLRLCFNAPLKQETVDANIVLSSLSESNVNVKFKEFYTINADSYFYFEPETALELNTEYTVSIKTALEDEYGQKISEEQEFKFITREEEYWQGNIIENYDNIYSFWDPNSSGSTVGTEEQETQFTISTERKMFGYGSGRLDYVFSGDSAGLCREYNSYKPVVEGDNETEIGVWVFGDNSNNLLEYWFYHPDNKIIELGNINWAGWEFKHIPKASISGSGVLQFHSMVVRQVYGANLSGTLYFDDAQYSQSTSNIAMSAISNNWISTQLFPNPANNYTFIQFNLKNKADISIDVYNLSGKKIQTIYEASNISGEHLTQWIPDKELENGVYLVKIEAYNKKTAIKAVQNLKLIIAH